MIAHSSGGGNPGEGGPGRGDDARQGIVQSGCKNESNSKDSLWSSDVEIAFREALFVFPESTGRKKIKSPYDNEMYTRNDLISQYIKKRTGKDRTRKQITSHLQVFRNKTRIIEKDVEKAHSAPFKFHNAQGLQTSKYYPTSEHTPSMVAPDTQHSPPVHSSYQYHQARPFSPSYVDHTLSPVYPQVVANVHFQESQCSSGRVDPHNPYYQPPPAQQGIPQIPPSMHVQETHPMHMCFPPNAHPIFASRQPSPLVAMPTDPSMSTTSGPSILAGPVNASEWASSQTWGTGRTVDLPLTLKELIVLVEGKAAVEKSNLVQHHVIANITPAEEAFKAAGTSLEAFQLNHIISKFQTGNGLQQLFEKGPKDRFFVIKANPDLNSALVADQNASFAVTTHFQSANDLGCVECITIMFTSADPKQENTQLTTAQYLYREGRFIYPIQRSLVVELSQQFSNLQNPSMQAALAGLCIVQVVLKKDTKEILLCLVYIFEEDAIKKMMGLKSSIYKLK